MKMIPSIAAILVAVVVAPALNAQEVAVQVKEEKPGLLAQATVKPDSAQRIALAQVPGGKITEFEIEEEDGILVYEFKIASQDGEREIYVDAKTGALVTSEKEDSPAMGAGMSEGEPGLLAQATVKADSAEQIALQSVPGGTIVKREIEREAGRLVYSFEIKVGADPVKEVKVDAMTGALVKVEKE
jgi:uncharacterized membrane protein YkoI